MDLTEQDFKDSAERFAGNWNRFNSFIWTEKPDNSDKWGMYYTSNRDSADSITLSNERVIKERLKNHIARGNIREERHTHWAVGYVDALVIKVYDCKGRITKAFRDFQRIRAEIEQYPILDEGDCSDMLMELESETWEQAVRHHIRFDLERKGLHRLAALIMTPGAREPFEKALEAIGGYWDESNSGPYPIGLEKDSFRLELAKELFKARHELKPPKAN